VVFAGRAGMGRLATELMTISGWALFVNNPLFRRNHLEVTTFVLVHLPEKIAIKAIPELLGIGSLNLLVAIGS
jgi:hypothetical protein